MHHPSRPPNPPDGSTTVTTKEGSEGDPPTVAGANTEHQLERLSQTRFTGGGESDSPTRCRTQGRPIVSQIRSAFRRVSSGYSSLDSDSLPSSPLSPTPTTADAATQTPSLTGQVVQHALRRMSETHGDSPNPFSTRHQHTAEDMTAVAFGQELRRIGDQYDRLLMQRREAGGPRPVVILPNLLPHIYQEPTALLCMGLLLLLVGRLMQDSMSSQDHSQV
ncbi:bcl-2-like protein 11 [Parambassis ranga]|uniref:Bcl-2-like protein 11 n=1 Tax=Parambassis ranga TaxID=210632 RepID=A0A6P7JTS1_9TELE|nr:bcl-2-like protein 11 [Parambassis ranga]